MAWDGWLTLLAPLAAIGLALATRRIVPSLLVGILVAAVVAAHGAVLGGAGHAVACFLGEGCPEDRGAIAGLAAYAGEAVVSWDNARVTLFTLLVAASVAVMSESGATTSLVGAISRLARGPRGAQLSAWVAGLLVFFDDYASCLIVGGSMGPVFDRWGVSRAKLAYIVDSTSAPIASLALVGTWIGFEVGLLDQALVDAGHPPGGGYALFLEGLPYRFYPIFALGLVGIVALMGRDVGPMVAAERATRAQTEPVVTHDGARPGVLAAALPVLALVVATLITLVVDGVAALGVPLAEARAFQILEGADSYRAMMHGGAAALAVAAGVALLARTLDPAGVARAAWHGAQGVLAALAVLYCAWTLGNAISDTAAQDFLVGLLSDQLDPVWLPTAVFLVACGVSFATGTSFGTMTILVPLAVPLGSALGQGDPAVLAMTASSVLAGACFGDHLSPVSDTTVLSSVGSQVDVVTHARTQAPYGLLAGAAAVLFGTVPAAFGVPVWALVPIGLAALAGFLWLVGTPGRDAPA